MNNEFSPWFPANDVDPVHVGWYQCKGDFVDGKLVMRYWDGLSWFWRDCPGSLQPASVSGRFFNDYWRGLAVKT